MMDPGAERNGNGVVMPHAAVTTFRTASVAYAINVPFEAFITADLKRNRALFGEGDCQVEKAHYRSTIGTAAYPLGLPTTMLVPLECHSLLL